VVGERHERGESSSRWQANPSNRFFAGKNDGPAREVVGAYELENIEILFRDYTGEWLSMEYQA
jgi:hypothetical protein